MKINIQYKIILLILIHLVLGYLLTFPGVSKVVINTIFLFSILNVLYSKNKKNEVLYWSIYIASLEVISRMTNGLYAHESAKYLIIILLTIGIFIEKENRPFNIWYIFYIFSLFFSLLFVDFPTEAFIRSDIAMSLSGPVLAGFSAVYFYKREIKYNDLINAFKFALLPVVSILVFLYFKTPDFSEITFNTSANFETSGGFGPNQVATFLGFEMLILGLIFLTKNTFSGIIIIDIILALYLLYRSLLTFSRGGVLTALVAIAFFIIYQMYYFPKKNFKKYITIFIVSLVFISLIWNNVNQITNGMIFNRYSGLDVAGNEKQSKFSNRENFFDAEWQIFKENPFIGVGGGMLKYVRSEEYNIEGATHSELTRMLSEHGMIGVVNIIFLILFPLINNLKKSYFQRSFTYVFLIFWFLTINHSSMRIALPGLIYGMSLITLIEKNEDENLIHRQ